MLTTDDIASHIRDVPDFPKPGIIFKDITPLLASGPAFGSAVDQLVELLPPHTALIAAPEARGFIFGCTLAVRCRHGFVPIRKSGKLPSGVASHTYDLEYGQDTVEMHVDAIQPGQTVVLVDDVLATGGTMNACAKLVESRGGIVSACVFLMELDFLDGRSLLKDYSVRSLIHF